jgi:hypothetical protein
MDAMTDKTPDPEKYENLGNGLWLRRDDVPLTPEEEAEFYGRGELKAFTRPPRPKDSRPLRE